MIFTGNSLTFKSVDWNGFREPKTIMPYEAFTEINLKSINLCNWVKPKQTGKILKKKTI